MAEYSCKICGNKYNNNSFIAKEMMFGTKDKFTYFKCDNCGCLQIATIPKNISKYYPENYYSFIPQEKLKENFFKSFIKKNIIRPFLFLAPSNIKNNDFFALQIEAKLKPKSRILDVGCGSGKLLKSLSNYGYQNLIGVDPYIKNDFKSENVTIYKKDIFKLSGNYDLIMLHHVFEHMKNPLKVFKSIKRLLKKNGKILIRIPLVSSFAWQKYKTNWVQLDAPRHLFLHTPESVKILAKKSGLKIKKIVYDSTDFQFWGSIQYQRGIPLFSKKSYCVNPNNSIFEPNDIGRFKLKSQLFNKNQKGDQAAFWLIKK